MTTLAAPTTLGPPDFERDQWGRPLVVPADGGRPRPYTRASSAAKTVEDTFNLELWARRNVAFGMARDNSLVARVLALGGDPSTWDLAVKKQANQIVEDASAVSLSHRAADIGTALHRLTEMLDRGDRVPAGPYEADLEAYVNALITAGLRVVEVECRLVCDELEMAGTADRILANGAHHLIADIKTGETIDYGGLGWAAQLAAYAHSQLYDVETAIRKPPPVLDKTTGLIIHLPAGRGICTLYEIDLVAGYRAATLANEIRAIRRAAKRWISPFPIQGASSAPTTLPVTVGAEDRRIVLRDRWTRLDGSRRQAFADRHISPDDLDALEHALDELTPVLVDEEVLAASADVDELNARLLVLTPEQTERLNVVARQALAAQSTPIVFRFQPFERNVHVCRALLACCEANIDDEGLRELIAVAIGDELQTTIPTGAALGVLTIAEAQRLDEMATAAIPT